MLSFIPPTFDVNQLKDSYKFSNLSIVVRYFSYRQSPWNCGYLVLESVWQEFDDSDVGVRFRRRSGILAFTRRSP